MLLPATSSRQWKEELKTWLKFHPEPWDRRTKHEYHEALFKNPAKSGLIEGTASVSSEKNLPAEIVAERA